MSQTLTFHFPDGSSTIHYLHTDHTSTTLSTGLGSWTAVTDETGTVVDEQCYDAWGNRRDPATWTSYNYSPPEPKYDRGFTGHVQQPFGLLDEANQLRMPIPLRNESGKHLDGFQLINPDTLHFIALSGSATANFSLHSVCENQASAGMNGRMYDPIVSRMLAPDNFVQTPDFSQNFNRYSYALNNPLMFTDPSGEFLTWSFNKNGFSIGFNLTPIGIPVGAGINIGWSDGASLGGYSEVGYRVGGTGFGSGVTLSQSFDYNFNHSNWSTTTSENAYASFGLFNAGVNFSQTYDMTSKQWSNGWGVNAGVGIGNERAGIGLNIGYGSEGFSVGLGGFYNPEIPEVYKSPISNNFGDQNGECVLRCFEEFSSSYGNHEHDYLFWLDQNEGKLGVHASKVKGLIDNTGVYKSDRIIPQNDIYTIATAFTNDKRILMGFQTSTGGEHAVMIRKVKIWSSGRYKIYFSETSPVRIAPRSTSNLFKIPGAAFWTFYQNY